MQKTDFKYMGKIENLIAIQIATNILKAYYVVNFNRKNQIKILIISEVMTILALCGMSVKIAVLLLTI